MLSLLNIDYSSMISTLPLDSGSSDSLSNFINNGLVGLVTEADTTYKIAGSVIALILALIGCFFGYKLSRLFMGITGFIAGAIIGQIVASQILHVEGFASVLCIILCGAFIASLAFWIYRIGIFILCFALAFSAAGTLFPFEGDVQFFANVITGLIVLRIEDTDQGRYCEEALGIIYRTLEKTGLKHDEGPDKDGGFARITNGLPAARFASTSSLERCRQCLSYTLISLPPTFCFKESNLS